MRIPRLHSWELTPAAAVALQRELAGRSDLQCPLADYDLIAGADVSYDRFSRTVHAGVVVLRASDLTQVEKRGAVGLTAFPYIPGLLSFREAPTLLRAFGGLKTRPDVVLLDGQGLAHPRRFGLACHLGLWLNLPCLGCAKSRLVGQFSKLGLNAGAKVPLIDRDQVIGSVVRTKTGVRPVFVSPGHKIDLASSIRVVLRTCRGYRLPEPTRQAHLYVNDLRRNATC